jgi:hypothetical protein
MDIIEKRLLKELNNPDKCENCSCQFQDEGHYPDKFLEDFYGIKLLRYQKIILKQMLKIVK